MKFILLFIFSLISTLAFSQDEYFDKKKWKENTSDSICSSYRGCVALKLVFNEVNGKSKRQTKKLLGAPDFISKDDSGILYFSYYMDEPEECKANKKIKSSISFLIKDNQVFDVTKVNTGG